MKILYITSEAAPYAASGGLGDVMGALPHAVGNSGNEVAVMLPLYQSMKQVYRDRLELVMDISFNLSWRKTGASIFKIVDDGIAYYFVENQYYFNRPSLYGEFDDGERFAFFSRAVVEYLLQSGNIPDILHANDWQTALTIVYLKTEYSNISAFEKIKTVYTIHNIEYQGKYDPYILGDVFGLDGRYRDILEFDGALNLMKGAIVASDFVTTVSPNYANELENDYFAFGLAGIIKSAKSKMTGVINGIDYGYFSPERGGDIYQNYSITDLKSGKNANKKAFCEEIGFEYDERTPLIVMITRLATAKGIDLVLCILEELLGENVQVAVLGTGEREYEDKLRDIESRHQNMRAILKFDRVISKKMYAAADMFLMPSKSEPCGLAQMIACSYGTVPIVRSVGGLYDSISNYRDGGNGFRFDNYNAHELLFTIKDAIALYSDIEKWTSLVERAKLSDFTWENSAAKYIDIYNKLQEVN